MITVRDVESTLYNWAPSGLAASWDNVGLLVGAPDREVKKNPNNLRYYGIRGGRSRADRR